MANILYGVNGEGSGHSSRAREVITHLEAQGHRVYVASFDRGYSNLKNDFDVVEIDGLRLAYVHNRVRYGKTVVRNLLRMPQVTRRVRALGRMASDWNLDLVISDFEPITCHFGHKLGIPVITIDNQHVLTDTEISYPREYRKEAAAAKLVTRLMTPRARARLVISFFRARIKKKSTFLFSPILRQQVLKASPHDGEALLVYVTSGAAELADLLKTVPCHFICYGFNREGQDQNLEFRKPGLDSFLSDLSHCRAVIANAGFSLISEALYLGKPYLAWPVKRQFEQIFNAFYIEQMGYGMYRDELSRQDVELFLSQLSGYRENLATYPRMDNSVLFGKLDRLIANFVR